MYNVRIPVIPTDAAMVQNRFGIRVRKQSLLGRLVVQNRFGIPFWLVDESPILEPILVVGLGCSLGYGVLTHGHPVPL